MFTLDLPTILQHSNPGAKWCVRGDQFTYANLEWMDVAPKPTEQELLDAELAASKAKRIALVKTEASSKITSDYPDWKQNNVSMDLALGLVSYDAEKAITDATNASPIVISVAAHGYKTGDKVTVAGVVGNTAANVSDSLLTVVDANSFSLNGTTGDGAYISGGTSKRQAQLGCRNDIKAIRDASDAAESDIDALSTVAGVIAFTW